MVHGSGILTIFGPIYFRIMLLWEEGCGQMGRKLERRMGSKEKKFLSLFSSYIHCSYVYSRKNFMHSIPVFGHIHRCSYNTGVSVWKVDPIAHVWLHFLQHYDALYERMFALFALYRRTRKHTCTVQYFVIFWSHNRTYHLFLACTACKDYCKIKYDPLMTFL